MNTVNAAAKPTSMAQAFKFNGGHADAALNKMPISTRRGARRRHEGRANTPKNSRQQARAGASAKPSGQAGGGGRGRNRAGAAGRAPY